MKYAVIQTGGKQYRVSEGDVVELELLKTAKDQIVDFDKILLFVNEGSIKIGKPMLSDVSVKGLVLEHFKGDKIRVAKFKAKARYRKVMGHRQRMTRVRIEGINQVA
jgi:large subunit ribosomal protein L21